MAPAPPIGREGALARVARGELPFSMGSPHPTVAVLEQDGRFRIRELVIDQAAAQRCHEEARRSGAPFTPESYYALGEPTGKIHVEAATREELLEKMQRMPWPLDW